MTEQPKYDVALSFAGEDRDYVEAVAASLRDKGVRVFYDNYEQVELWGKDLYSHLDYIYRTASRYCVIFISEHYAAKVWTNHERSSAQARAIEENTEYVLPARFDDTTIPGLRPTIGYLSLKNLEPAEVAAMVQQKLGPRRVSPGFPSKIDRLLGALGISLDSEEDAKRRQRAGEVAYAFYEALRRMTEPEKKAVAGAFAFGCPGELPDGMHVSLDYLSRMTKMPPAEVMDALAAVRSLNVKVRVRDPKDVHPSGTDDELQAEDKDLLVSFWAVPAGDSNEGTLIAAEAVRQAAYHFCADHGLEVVTALDFHRLASDVSGPITVEN